MRDITLCHPRIQLLASRLITECANQGLKIKITETLRTAAEQDSLYAQGRTSPGKIVTNAKGSSYSSTHQWGIAFDFCRNDGMGAYNESGKFFDQVGSVGISLGLEWGGGWKSIKDKPHFQLPDWGSTPEELKRLHRNPEEFIKSWDSASLSPGWVNDAYGWWYQRSDGTFPQNKWCLINHHWYLFNRDGYLCTGWHRWDGRTCDPYDGSGDWYYFDTTQNSPTLGACWHERADDKGVLEVWTDGNSDSI